MSLLKISKKTYLDPRPSGRGLFIYDKAVIVSGDGDFHCLHEFLEREKKLLSIVVPNAKTESSLLKRFQQYKTFIIYEKTKLEK